VEATHAIAVEGKRIEATYRIELNQDLTTVAKESLSLGGKSVDLASGQVFLIDLTADMPPVQAGGEPLGRRNTDSNSAARTGGWRAVGA
jgi:hypothetical protein